MKMSEKTAERLIQRLVKELEAHPHKDEVVRIALEQLMDD